MGGGLNFLNKKTWHPARPQNLEEVWKREQKAAAEAKKAEELRKQLEEERKRSEFVQMAMDTGHLRKEERLDWMYGSGLQAKQDAEKRREDMLTGKTEVALAPEQRAQETSRAEQVALLPTFYASATPASQNETWLRLNNDPLFAIKRQQQEQLSKLRENPIKMMELLKNLAKAKEKAEKKKEKKEKKSRKRERDSGSDSSGEEGDGRAVKRSRSPPAPSPRYGAGSHERQAPPRGHHELEHEYHQPPVGARGRSPSGREGHDRGRGRGYPEREQDYRRQVERYDRMEPERKPQRGHERDYARSAEHHDKFNDRDSAHRDSRQEGRSGPGGGAGRQDGREREAGRSRHEGDRRTQERDHERRRDRDGGKDDRDGGGEGVQQQERARKHGGEEHLDVSGAGRDTSPARGREERQQGDRYGLKHSSAAPEVLLQADNSNRAAETRAKLEEARRIREEEERAKAAQRYVRKDYKTGQMTEEERQRRLAEMMGNAEEHEMGRRRRLDAAAAADLAQEESQRIVSQANAARGSDAFRDAAARDVYAKLQGSLEARVNSRRHFSAR
ncbi:hypothetical protein Vafri_5718 [Volvox africanus]|nr:hypothetical protein Vafri_5718 [Volvox africanus]